MKVLFQFNLDHFDFAMWALVLVFFGASATLFGGDVQNTLLGSCGIIVLMLFVSHSIGLIIGVLSAHPRLGELTGYITNGPEALVTIVGLLHGKLNMAMGVPLGSNFANPLLLTLAAMVTGMFLRLYREDIVRTGLILLATMGLAATFFGVQNNPGLLWAWVFITVVATLLIYRYRGVEVVEEETEEPLGSFYLLPAIVTLVAAGYFLDPAVSYTAANSHVPEGVISFCVLSVVTSWPEFRTSITLMRSKRLRPAVMNIVVSNITNLWLATGGAALFLLFYNH